MSFRLGIDIGGTFTDFVAVDEETGELHRAKCLTTPDDPIEGILTGVRRLQSDLQMGAGAIASVAHATTLVANALIERKGAVTGLIATEGFRDILEVGNDTRYDMYDLDIAFPEPLVPRPLRLGVKERLDADGEPLEAPNEAEVIGAIRSLIEAGVRSVAVCLLHSYRNADHERRIRDVIAARFPGLDVSISAEIAPEIREYERTCTTVANAYVRPLMRSYLQRLRTSLADAGVAGGLVVMLSNGGVASVRAAADAPIRLVESGPTAGVLAACACGRASGENNLIAFDMGGTTAKVCIVHGGEPAFTGTVEVARVKRQFRGSGVPLKVASIDMAEIGAGGGSIAAVDGVGMLKVGPESAGSKPGPACYGLGGTAPTVTDADLVLGYLDPNFFLGGEMPLERARAEAAVKSVAEPLKLGMAEAAAGIAGIVNNNMATALRIHAAERGLDYRGYTLFAFGGAGPVHAYGVARMLGLRRIVCPPGAGTNSALGLLVAPPALDLARSYYATLETVDWAHLNAIYLEMEREALDMLAQVGVTAPGFARTAEMRFLGQGFEVTSAVPGGKLSADSVPAMRAAFEDAYRALFRSVPEGLPVEALTWRLRAVGPAPKLQLAAAIAGTPGVAARRGERQAYFADLKSFVATPVYDRYALRTGDRFHGPALIEERESTLVVGPAGRISVNHQLGVVVDMS